MLSVTAGRYADGVRRWTRRNRDRARQSLSRQSGGAPTPLSGISAIADLSADLFVQQYERDSAPVGPKKISGNDRLA